MIPSGICLEGYQNKCCSLYSCLYVHAACLYPCFMSMLLAHAACPCGMSLSLCCMSMTHIHSACPWPPDLKVHLHEIFDFCFFPSKAPTWSPDLYPKFVSIIKSNPPRYSNYSSLCVDSVNAELIFCFKLIKTVNIFWLVLASFEHFIVNFSKYYPFKGARAGYVCLL